MCASRVCRERMLGRGCNEGLEVRGAGVGEEETRETARRWEGVVRHECIQGYVEVYGRT